MSEWPAPEEDAWAGWDEAASPRRPGPPTPGRTGRFRPGRRTWTGVGAGLLALLAGGGWYTVDQLRQRAAAVAYVMPSTADGLPRSDRPPMDDATGRTGARLDAAVPGRFTVTGAAYGDGTCRLALVVAAHRRGGELQAPELVKMREALMKAVPTPGPESTRNCPVTQPFTRALRLDRNGGAVVLLNEGNADRHGNAVLDDVLREER
jgi:hypothetical protein